MVKPFQLTLLSLLYALLLLSACHSSRQNTASDSAKDYAGLGYVQATVIKYDVDGCKWLLQIDEVRKLVPATPLPAEFQQEALPVWIKYTLKKGGAGFCMAGEIIEITDIKRRK